MLEGLRKASQNWVGRSILFLTVGVVALSFLVWGVGDMLRSSLEGRWIAKIGSSSISIEAFQSTYQQHIQALQRQLRQPITPGMIQTMGLDTQVLSQMIAETTLDHQIKELALTLSDADVAASAQKDPAFQDSTGRFNPALFQAILRDNGWTEGTFLQKMKGFYLRRQLSDALLSSFPAPLIMSQAVHRLQSETSTADFIFLSPQIMGEISPPLESDLEAYFTARKELFRILERRSGLILSLTPLQLTASQQVEETEILSLYDKVKATRFTRPETRVARQIIFKTQQEAETFRAGYTNGSDLSALAQEAQLSLVELGELQKGQVFDKTVEDAIFSLKEIGTLSPVVKGTFGYALVQVTKITPSALQPYEDVRSSLRQEIALEKAKDKMQSLQDMVEEQHVMGKNLKEIAIDNHLSLEEIPLIDMMARETGGNFPAPLVSEHVRKVFFTAKMGSETDPILSPDGGVVWIEITKIEPSYVPQFEEARPSVLAQWKKEEMHRRLAAKASELVARLNAGESLEKVAHSVDPSLKIQHIESLSRQGSKDWNETIAKSIFEQAIGRASSLEDTNGNRLIFQVTGRTIPPFVDNKQQAKSLGQQWSASLLNAYLMAQQNRLGVQLNETMLRSLTRPNTSENEVWE